MEDLARQLIERQVAGHDPFHLEDRYEMRLPAPTDTKLRGKGIRPNEKVQPDETALLALADEAVDLMVAGKHCFGSFLVSVGAVCVLPFRYEIRILLIFLKKCL
jgi:non-homologous end joining protein Ku